MPVLDIASDLTGSDSVVGNITQSGPNDLSGSLLGIATVTGELTALNVFHSSPPLLGIATLIGDGGATNGLETIIPIAASLEGSDFLIGDGTVADADVEPPENPLSPCSVVYDIETCRCVTI